MHNTIFLTTLVKYELCDSSYRYGENMHPVGFKKYKMIFSEDGSGLDGATLIPIDCGGSLVSRSRAQSTSVMELGKKLLQSAREGDTAAVLDLMSKGAPFTTDWLGTSPLHLAAMNNHLETCDVLLRAGIGKDGRTKVDRTPLHFAAYEGHSEVAKLLLEHNVEVNCRDMLQMTPLHWAVERGHKDSVLVLLHSGANPRAESKFQKTPLSIAAEMGWDSMVDLLQSNTTREATMSIQDMTQEIEQETPEENKYLTQEINVLNELNTECNTETPIEESENSQEVESDGMDHENEAQNLASLLPQGEEYTNEATMQLLKEHGITMIPADNTTTVTSALQSGRRIVLSDAGKLILKDSKFHTEPTKPVEIKTKPIILPTGKIKSTKIYTMSSSQFLAMTGQSKPNILQKVPIEMKKVENGGINLVQLPKTAQFLNMNSGKLTKTVNIMNKTPVKPGLNTITVMKQGKGNILSFKGNTLSKVHGNIQTLNSLTNQGKKTKVIQLKSGSTLSNAVKIVVNKNSLGKFITQIPSTENSQISNGLTNNNIIEAPINAQYASPSDKSAESTTEVERLRAELKVARSDADEYRKKIQALQNELQLMKSKLNIRTLHTIVSSE